MNIEYIVTFIDVDGKKAMQFFDNYNDAFKRYISLCKSDCVSYVKLRKEEDLSECFFRMGVKTYGNL